jgi:hypothetical protein
MRTAIFNVSWINETWHKNVAAQQWDMSHIFVGLRKLIFIQFSVNGPSVNTKQAGRFGLVPTGLVQGFKNILYIVI